MTVICIVKETFTKKNSSSVYTGRFLTAKEKTHIRAQLKTVHAIEGLHAPSRNKKPTCKTACSFKNLGTSYAFNEHRKNGNKKIHHWNDWS